jgi:glycosyltransferase involved in cell wall biosynthesis
MKVLMYGWEFPPYNSGGLGVACYGLTRALSKKNVDVTFVLPKKFDVASNFMRFVFADGTNVRFLEVDALLAPYMTSQIYDRERLEYFGNIYGASLFDEVLRYARASLEIAKREKFDLVHAHDWLSFMAGEAAKGVSHRPLVVHVHATEYDRTGGWGINPRVYDIERNGAKNADRVIAVSSLTKDILTYKYGIEADKISVVHNGVDPSSYNLVSQGDVEGLSNLKKRGYGIVLFVGRITLQKGPDYFLRAAQKCLSYNPKIKFIIAGSGDMDMQIVTQTARMGISDKVLFAGFLRGEELSSLYRMADLFVMPSVSEPFGLTALESLVHGTPILISKQTGVSEVVSHALKTDFWDIDDMADKILAVLEYSKLKKTLSQNGRIEAMKCSWDIAADKCIEVYKSLL